jgi:YVTN family beta-propeller protein
LTFVSGKVWFTAEGAKAIGSYDPATQKVDWVLGTGQNRTHMIFVFPDLKRIVTSNVSSGTVTISEKVLMRGGPPGAPPHEDWDETVVPVGKGSEGFDVSPDAKESWVANAGDGTISIIDLTSKKVIQTVAANVESANRLKFTPDGKRVLVSGLRLPDVAVFDAATRSEVKRVKVGHGAAGIEMQPGGSHAYVSCTPDDYVAVIDLKTFEVTGKIEAGKGPDGLAWAIQR